jgi:ABC-2 type transport system ATP-binding protein
MGNIEHIELKIQDLSKHYGNTIGLNHFSFTFTKGVYGILGPNGAGKSTLMNLLTDNHRKNFRGNSLQ